jgi:hypothetical protein
LNTAFFIYQGRKVDIERDEEPEGDCNCQVEGLEVTLKKKVAAEGGRHGRHEPEADQAEQVPAVVGVQSSLSV